MRHILRHGGSLQCDEPDVNRIIYLCIFWNGRCACVSGACASFIFERKQMRHNMNRTVYQPYPGCGCRHGMQHPGGAASGKKPDIRLPQPCGEPQNTGSVCGTPVQEGVLAMAYVHVQTLGELYDPCTALIAGTLFPALDKPFCGDTVSASAYPNPPARTCDCTLPARREGGCCVRGGDDRD